MATVVNTPPSEGGGMGFLLGIIILIVFIVVLLIYGLPYLQNSFGGGAQINIPDKVDVNVNQSK